MHEIGETHDLRRILAAIVWVRFVLFETMGDLKCSHYKLSNMALSTIGLWPYDKF